MIDTLHQNSPDLTGRQIGSLRVINFVGYVEATPGGGRSGLWSCRCVCGDEISITASRLNAYGNRAACPACREKLKGTRTGAKFLKSTRRVITDRIPHSRSFKKNRLCFRCGAAMLSNEWKAVQPIAICGRCKCGEAYLLSLIEELFRIGAINDIQLQAAAERIRHSSQGR